MPASAPIVAEAAPHQAPATLLPWGRPGQRQRCKASSQGVAGDPSLPEPVGHSYSIFFSFKKKSPHHLPLGLGEIWGTQFDRDLARTLTLLALA